MNWKMLTSEQEFQDLLIASNNTPQLIFKHSTRCSISAMVKNRLEKRDPVPGVDFHYLDLIKYRNVSNLIADSLMVEHESPQALLVINGNCVYNESHTSIGMEDIGKAVGGK